MEESLFLHRLHFAFTITFHYIFPQLTMGLALLILVLKTLGLRSSNGELYDEGARFWARIFGINFVLGVVTGIPMEFQFGTNWSQFARVSGGVIGQPLAMEGTFSFFLESAFLGLFLHGEARLGKIGHWWAAFLVFLGSWLSGFFIVATNAWMQHPVAYEKLANGSYSVISFWGLLLNPWALLQYAHTMSGAVITGAFVMAATGAYYRLEGKFLAHARSFLKIGVIAGVIATAVQIFPTGDLHGKFVARYQPVTTAAMEGLFATEAGAPVVLLGQPDPERGRIDNPLALNEALSFLIYGTTRAEVKGLNEFPRENWPSSIPLLYFSYHIMAGLGTIFALLMLSAALLLYTGKLDQTRPMLWALMLSAPLPFVANIAGWTAAEAGRQPWLIYGLMRTADGSSSNVHAGNSMFTLLGFMGLYAVLSILFLFLIRRELERGPQKGEADPAAAVARVEAS